MLTVAPTDHGFEIRRDGRPLLRQNAAPGTRPYLHPIHAPDGGGVLTEDAPPRPPWQRGLGVGLNDVNGVGFWEEGPRGRDTDGSFHPEPLAEPVTTSDCAIWEVAATWRDPAGADLLRETQAWSLDVSAGVVLDMAWTLTARVDLTFGQSACGGLILRMPWSAGRGGRARNSEGQEGASAEGQAARWAAVAMVVDGRDGPAGMALLDHPRNPGHPVRWCVDAQLGICPSRCLDGPWALAAGEATVSRYRVVPFVGEVDAARLDAAWDAFAAT